MSPINSMTLRLLRSTVCAGALLFFAGVSQAAPPNDDLANAQVIPTGSSFSVVGNDQNATLESFEETSTYPRLPDFNETVWYSWTSSISGSLAVGCSAGGPMGLPSLIHIFKGPATPSASTYIVGTAEFSTGPAVANVTAGQQYFICISDSGDQAHPFSITGAVTPSSTPPPLPAVTVKAKIPMIERSSEKERFIFTLSTAPASALVLNYKVAGSAVAGTDYERLPGKVTVPAGQTKVTVRLLPLHAAGAEGTKAVRIKLKSNGDYTLGDPSSATVKILESH